MSRGNCNLFNTADRRPTTVAIKHYTPAVEPSKCTTPGRAGTLVTPLDQVQAGQQRQYT